MNRFDYFEFFGIKIFYLSLIFILFMVDNGYDVLDFKDIDFLFGNMNDFDEFFKEIYVRGMKVMLDFVFNYILD